MERMKAKKDAGMDFEAQIMHQELLAKDQTIWQHSAAEQGRLLFEQAKKEREAAFQLMFQDLATVGSKLPA